MRESVGIRGKSIDAFGVVVLIPGEKQFCTIALVFMGWHFGQYRP